MCLHTWRSPAIHFRGGSDLGLVSSKLRLLFIKKKFADNSRQSLTFSVVVFPLSILVESIKVRIKTIEKKRFSKFLTGCAFFPDQPS